MPNTDKAKEQRKKLQKGVKGRVSCLNNYHQQMHSSEVVRNVNMMTTIIGIFNEHNCVNCRFLGTTAYQTRLNSECLI